MTTNPVTAPNSGVSATQGIAGIPANMQISESGFLQLITTQLQAQNPLQPTDPTQFLSQIEGMSEVSSMQSMQSALQASQVLSGTSLLGKTVLAPGSTATLAAGGTVSGAVNAPAGASSLLVTVTDSTGAAVKTFSVSPQASGLTPFTWDGTTSAGTPAAAGQYTLSVAATVSGASQPVDPYVQSKVSSVTIDPTSQALDLDTDNGTVALSSVASVM
ncbi:MAG: flagellar hook assembly protein FlgD [Steroidobacteraceae bacterium]